MHTYRCKSVYEIIPVYLHAHALYFVILSFLSLKQIKIHIFTFISWVSVLKQHWYDYGVCVYSIFYHASCSKVFGWKASLRLAKKKKSLVLFRNNSLYHLLFNEVSMELLKLQHQLWLITDETD